MSLPQRTNSGRCSECLGQWWMHVDSAKIRNMGHVTHGFVDDYTEIPGRLDLERFPVLELDCEKVAKRKVKKRRG